MQAALQAGAQSCLLLDSTSPAGLSLLIEVENTNEPISLSPFELPSGETVGNSGVTFARTQTSHLKSLVSAHLAPAEFDLDGIVQLLNLITDENHQIKTTTGAVPRYRKSATYFTAPGLGTQGDEVVFPTVSPFLIEQRVTELMEWARHELEEGNFHPLFIIGTFHLLFLQIHPFSTANHRLALLLLWRLLDAHGYGFVRYSHFAPEMNDRSRQYFSALRQAERTACGNWSTLNIWLELFLDTLILASNRLMDVSERHVSSSRLTSVQRKIIDVIKSNGTATREKIVNETGINLSTVKYNLSVLASKGHLKRDGGGRTTSYRVL